MADLPSTLAPLQVTGNAKGRLIFCPSVASTPGSPRAYVRVTRWLASTGEWKTLAKLMLPGTSVTSAGYVDSSTIKDDRVRYSMRIINQDGTKQESLHSSAYADAWQIGPKAPVIYAVMRTAPDKITVSYRNPSVAASKIRLYLAASGDGGKTFGSGVLAAEFDAPAWSTKTLRSYVLTVSPTLTYKVQGSALTTNPVGLAAEAKASFFPTVLKNVWSTPSIPSLVAPFADQLAGTVTFSWAAKPTDGTGQSGAQVEHRPVGGSTTTITITGDAATAQTAAALATGQYEWRCRTKHASGAYGPWSGWSEFAVTTAPSLTISYPDDGQTVPTNKPALLLDWYSPSGATIATWGARLTQGATVKESRSGKGPISSLRFAAALADATSYTVEVWATASNALATPTDSVTFPVLYTRPGTPTAPSAVWHEGEGVVAVAATYGASTTSTAIDRSVDDGDTWTRAGVGPGGTGTRTIQDQLAPTGLVGVLYRAVAITNLGVEAYSSSVAVTTRPANDVWLVGADGTRCRLRANIKLNVTDSQDVVSEQYYGHDRPTAHYGDARPLKIGITGTLCRNTGIDHDWTGLLGQPVHYRDPDGRHGWGTLDASGIQQSSEWTEERAITATWEATTYDPEDDG